MHEHWLAPQAQQYEWHWTGGGSWDPSEEIIVSPATTACFSNTDTSSRNNQTPSTETQEGWVQNPLTVSAI